MSERQRQMIARARSRHGAWRDWNLRIASYHTYFRHAVDAEKQHTAEGSIALTYTKRIQHARALAVLFSFSLIAAPVKIMPLGDSRTAGPDSRDCYRLYLDRMMTAAGYAHDFVGSQTGHNGGSKPPDSTFDCNHQGMWGWSIRYLLYNPSQGWEKENVGNWARSYNPDIVLAFLGTPDMLAGDSVRVKLPKTMAAIAAIIDTLRAVNPSVVVLLSNLYPAYPAYYSNASDLESLKVHIPEIVEIKNSPRSPLLLVDTWTGFSVSQLVDGLHSNQPGSIQVAQRWLDNLWPFFDSVPPAPSYYAVARPALLRSPAQPSGAAFFSLIESERRRWAFFTIAGRKTSLEPSARRERFFPSIVIPTDAGN